jgi:hypothetical protein
MKIISSSFAHLSEQDGDRFILHNLVLTHQNENLVWVQLEVECKKIVSIKASNLTF